MSYEVTLPWPPRECSPNWRGHWTAKAKAAKRYRKACGWAAVAAKLRVTWEGPVHLFVVFNPQDKHERDDDNLVAAFKSGRDGLADALSIDDKRFVMHATIGTVKAGGQVGVRLAMP